MAELFNVKFKLFRSNLNGGTNKKFSFRFLSLKHIADFWVHPLKSVSSTIQNISGTFEKNYKDVLSGFGSWAQRGHASDWVLQPENMGVRLGIDETSFCHEVYTVLHNKDGHGKKHTVIAMINGTKPSEVIKVLTALPQDTRLKVAEITMDLSTSMGAIAKAVFPNTAIVRDCFHVIQRCGEGIEENTTRIYLASLDTSAVDKVNSIILKSL